MIMWLDFISTGHIYIILGFLGSRHANIAIDIIKVVFIITLLVVAEDSDLNMLPVLILLFLLFPERFVSTY